MDKEAILSLLGPACSGSILYFDSIPSTNTFLKENAPSLEDGAVAVAAGQTAGKGRLGRSFQSPAGVGVYLSMLMRPDLPPEKLGAVTACAAVAVCDAVEAVCGTRPGIKWVNDLILGGRKICGILAEGAFCGGRMTDIVVGAGVNANTPPCAFSGDVSHFATSILQETGVYVELAALASQMILALDRLRRELPSLPDRYLELYRRDSVLTGKTVSFTQNGGNVSGRVLSIGDDFSLIVETPSGERLRLTAGEVRVRPVPSV